jgi:hypothetical protein
MTGLHLSLLLHQRKQCSIATCSFLKGGLGTGLPGNSLVVIQQVVAVAPPLCPAVLKVYATGVIAIGCSVHSMFGSGTSSNND